jgi:hypothetical protein
MFESAPCRRKIGTGLFSVPLGTSENSPAIHRCELSNNNYEVP